MQPEMQTKPCACGRGEAQGYVVGDRVVFAGKCSLCVEEAERATEEALRQEREAKARAEHENRVTNAPEMLRRLGIGRKYLNATLGSFIPDADPRALEAAQDFVRRFSEGARPSLYLHSEREGEAIAPGCGKTHLAAGILHALALNPEIPLGDLSFVFVPKLLLEMQDTFKSPDRSELGIVEKYAAPELLVWDDFGAEKLSDYAARTLYTILYEREGKSNVFTSNLSLGDIEARDSSGYTQRITSRIVGDCRIIRMKGPDRRLRVA